MTSPLHTFQVDLRGMIDLLSEHLYGGPEVFVRELLQNGVDALTARAAREPGFAGRLVLDLPDAEAPTLVFTDDGVGLTADEVHTFLATIGRSSKRGAEDFIGQFGIGLLSCFVVADEIDLVTRSAKGGPAVRWVGFADGRYTLTELEGPDGGPDGEDVPVGTRVTLRAKPGREEFFDPERVRTLAHHYGAFLPVPIEVRSPGRVAPVNGGGAPWAHADTPEGRAALLDYGRALLGAEPLDAVPLRAAAGEVEGVAFILPWTPSLAARGRHRLYLRGMLLSEDDESLVPTWAFFVKAVLNARALRPNAARDALHEDATLREARAELGEALKAHLVRLAEEDPARLRDLIRLHFLSIKALALEDDGFFELFLPWLPFETSAGRATLPELLARGDELRFVGDLSLFRQVAQLAAATDRPVVHAVYTHDAALLEKYGALHPEVRVTRLGADDVAADLGEPAPEEAARLAGFLRTAREVLAPLDATARLAVFEPAELAALYLPAGSFRAELRRTRERVGGLWGDLLGDLDDAPDETGGTLHLNLANTLVRRAATLPDPAVAARVVGTLHVQALLLGHHPLGTRELRLLNDHLLAFLAGHLEDAERTLN